MPFHSLKFMTPLMPLVEANTTRLWTSFPGFGKPSWRNPLSNTQLSQWGHCNSSSEHMPFGLCDAPATFQQLMTNCLGELNYSTCLVYLDDVVIYLRTQEEHIECLRAVLECFRLDGLKLKPSKCEFFKEKIEYLGHSVSLKGVWPSRNNLKAITKYPEPTMYTAIKGFIGLVGHYRHFIKDFAKVADPLHEYARGDPAKKKRNMSS